MSRIRKAVDWFKPNWGPRALWVTVGFWVGVPASPLPWWVRVLVIVVLSAVATMFDDGPAKTSVQVHLTNTPEGDEPEVRP